MLTIWKGVTKFLTIVVTIGIRLDKIIIFNKGIRKQNILTCLEQLTITDQIGEFKEGEYKYHYTISNAEYHIISPKIWLIINLAYLGFEWELRLIKKISTCFVS